MRTSSLDAVTLAFFFGVGSASSISVAMGCSSSLLAFCLARSFWIVVAFGLVSALAFGAAMSCAIGLSSSGSAFAFVFALGGYKWGHYHVLLLFPLLSL